MQLDALRAEHENPTHASRQQVHDLAKPVVLMANRVTAQVAVYRGLLLEADYGTPEEKHPRSEMLHQTIDAMETLAREFVRVGRGLADAMSQWDRYMDETGVKRSALYETSGATPADAIG